MPLDPAQGNETGVGPVTRKATTSLYLPELALKVLVQILMLCACEASPSNCGETRDPTPLRGLSWGRAFGTSQHVTTGSLPCRCSQQHYSHQKKKWKPPMCPSKHGLALGCSIIQPWKGRKGFTQQQGWTSKTWRQVKEAKHERPCTDSIYRNFQKTQICRERKYINGWLPRAGSGHGGFSTKGPRVSLLGWWKGSKIRW